MLRLCRSLQHTTSRLELGFSTVSPGRVTCCSVLVHSQQLQLLLQTLQSSSVWHGWPGATGKTCCKRLWESHPGKRGVWGQGVPAPPGGAELYTPKGLQGAKLEKGCQAMGRLCHHRCLVAPRRSSSDICCQQHPQHCSLWVPHRSCSPSGSKDHDRCRGPFGTTRVWCSDLCGDLR